MNLIELRNKIDTAILSAALTIAIMPFFGLLSGTAISVGLYGANYQEISLQDEPERYWFIIKIEFAVVLLFLVLSSVGKLSKLTLLQKTILVGCISLGLEFAQLLPRPEILEHLHYTFDWLDVISSLVSLVIAYFIAKYIIQKYKSC